MTQSGAKGASPAWRPRIAVIGAGISGILVGIKLLERGFRDFVILEKAQDLGGTWRDNVYPGVACDVPAHLYVYSFAPNPGWRRHLAAGRDIWKYYHGVAKRFGVLPHIRYGKEIASADFDGGAWRLTAKDGSNVEADIVIGAVGRLHHPKYPDIPGADSFAGPSFHTARWDHSVEIVGRRVGVIGTGSTATQIVAAIAGQVGQLKLFQRTPQWVYPLPNPLIPWWRRLRLRLSPRREREYYETLRSQTEERGRAATGSREERAPRDAKVMEALQAVRDPELRAKLTPDYEVGCKRLVMSDTYYEAVQSSNVDVVVEPIDHIEATGVATRDGKLHGVDVLVFATGFDSQAYLRPMKVRGADGLTLDELWRDKALTYRSVAMPGMPNFFLINGPYSPGGSNSVVAIVEAQTDYVMQLVDRVAARRVTIAPRETASLAWLDGVRAKASQSVWGTGGCQSWYLDNTGVPTIDPTPLTELRAQLVTPNWEDFVEREANDATTDIAA